MLKILVEEEYGFRWWLWKFTGSKEELITDWKNGRIPLKKITVNGQSPPKKNFRGTLTEISLDEVEVHRFNPKYKDLWVMDGLNNKEAFKTPEYKALQEQFAVELAEKWPIRAHIFVEEDTYLIVDGAEYIPNVFLKK